jgi:uncharacterized protein
MWRSIAVLLVLFLVLGACASEGEGGETPANPATPTTVAATASAPPGATESPTLQVATEEAPTSRPATAPAATSMVTSTPSQAPTVTPTPDPRPLVVVASATGGHTRELRVEIAATPVERTRGLQHREHLDEDAGMLFLFEQPSTIGFWMKDTLIPLDIAYLGPDGTVQEVHRGEPLDETILWPVQAFYSVLEVNAGWFERNGFGVGDRVSLRE